MTSQASIVSFYTQYRGPSLGQFERASHIFGQLSFWLKREPICIPNRLRCAKPVLTVARYSDFYVYIENS